MCQEYITLGKVTTYPLMVGVAGNIPMYPGKCDSDWTTVANTGHNANGIFKFYTKESTPSIV